MSSQIDDQKVSKKIKVVVVIIIIIVKSHYLGDIYIYTVYYYILLYTYYINSDIEISQSIPMTTTPSTVPPAVPVTSGDLR